MASGLSDHIAQADVKDVEVLTIPRIFSSGTRFETTYYSVFVCIRIVLEHMIFQISFVHRGN